MSDVKRAASPGTIRRPRRTTLDPTIHHPTTSGRLCGAVTDVTGTIAIDGDAWQNAQIDVVIDTPSIIPDP